VAWIIIPLIVGMVFSTIVRFALGHSPLWTYDFAYMLGGSFFMLGAAYTLRLRYHVRIDMLYGRWPPRMKAAIDVFFGLLFFFPILIWLWLHSIEHAMFSWQIKERAVESVLRSIVYPFKTVIPVAILLLLLQGVAEFLRSLFALVRGREP